jgi:hypothetical protein
VAHPGTLAINPDWPHFVFLLEEGFRCGWVTMASEVLNRTQQPRCSGMFQVTQGTAHGHYLGVAQCTDWLSLSDSGPFKIASIPHLGHPADSLSCHPLLPACSVCPLARAALSSARACLTPGRA